MRILFFLRGVEQMDASEFQKKLSELLEYAESKGKTITREEARDFFFEAGLSGDQMDKIFQYLRIRGIEVAEKAIDSGNGADHYIAEEFVIETGAEKPGKKPYSVQELSFEDQEYLEDYLKQLPEITAFEDRQQLFARLNQGDNTVIHSLTENYLRTVAEMAVRMKSEDILLPDLIQEANLGLFEALSDTEYRQKNDQWVRAKILASIRKAVEEQEMSRDSDRALVDRVEKLEASIRDLLDEEDEDLKFSIEELAVILDMEEDEIRNILKLTGDGNEV